MFPDCSQHPYCGRADRRRRQAFEVPGDGNPEKPREIAEAGGGYPVGGVFVFVDLLQDDPGGLGEPLLGEAELLPPVAQPRPDMDVDEVKISVVVVIRALHWPMALRVAQAGVKAALGRPGSAQGRRPVKERAHAASIDPKAAGGR